MTPDELKAYKHERYKTNNFEITIRMKELTKDQHDMLVSILNTLKAGV